MTEEQKGLIKEAQELCEHSKAFLKKYDFNKRDENASPFLMVLDIYTCILASIAKEIEKEELTEEDWQEAKKEMQFTMHKIREELDRDSTALMPYIKKRLSGEKSEAIKKILSYSEETDSLPEETILLNHYLSEDLRKHTDNRSEYFDEVAKIVEQAQNEQMVSENYVKGGAKKLYIDRTKVNNLLFDKEGKLLANDLKDIKELTVGKNQKVQAVYCMSYDGIETTRPLTESDKIIFDAICSIWEEKKDGKALFTATNIYNTLNKSASKKGNVPPKECVADIQKCIDKLRTILYSIDVSKHLNDGKSYEYRDNFLKVKEIRADNESYYMIEEEPYQFTYAKKTKQVQVIDATLLSIPGARESEMNNAIKRYLLKRIWQFNNGAGTNTILLKTLFEELNIEEKKSRHDAREAIIKILDYWKECSFIADYTLEQENKQSRSFDKIKLHKKEQAKIERNVKQ